MTYTFQGVSDHVFTVSFFVEDIRPIKWNDQAYDHLVYDEQQKDLVLSFVESHGHTTHKVDDVIIGKCNTSQ